MSGDRLAHYWGRGAGLACCGADSMHGAPGEITTYEGDTTCLLCLRDLASGRWPGAADAIRGGFFYAAPCEAPPEGWPKLTYRPAGPHRYLVLFAASRYSGAPVVLGEVQRFGSLPSCQSWQARGIWQGAASTRSRPRRADAGRDLLAAWRDLIAPAPGRPGWGPAVHLPAHT